MVVIRNCVALAAMLLSATALAQAKAQIDGPTESQAGNLVVVSSAGSVADKTEWIIPDSLSGRYIQTGSQLAFAVRDAGAFTFHLVAVVVDETGPDIDVDSLTITITDGFGVCPPPVPDPGPDDPTNPGPVEPDPPGPTPIYEDIEQLSEKAARELGDPKTTETLARALATVKQDQLSTMRAQVSMAIEAVMLGRDRQSQDKDWLNVWRRPLDQLIGSKNITEPKDYLSAIQAMASGLMAAIGSSPPSQPSPEPSPPPTPAPAPEKPKVEITFLTQGDRCSWCVKWKRDELPKATKQPGWTVLETPTKESAPRFEVRVGNRVEKFVGYQSFETIQAAVKRLSND